MKKKQEQEITDIREDIPIRRYDKQKKCFQKEDGSYVNLYQIIPRDLVNSDVDEIEMDCFRWAKLLKTYGLDMEIHRLFKLSFSHFPKRISSDES